MDSVPGPSVQVGAGIDYITCSAARPHSVAALLALGRDLVAQEEGAGGVVRPLHVRGYAGWQAGGAGYGFTGTRALVRCSGPTARESAADLLGSADNCSRLDVQITVSSDACGVDYAERVYADVATSGRRRGRPFTRSLVVNSDGGSTLYIGRRISEQFGRIYNKSAEEKRPDNPPQWRFEVEYKGRTAKRAAWSYQSHPDRDSWCVSEVRSFFDARAITPPFAANSRVGLCGDPRGSDAQARQLEWLRIGVKPVLCRLALVYGWPDVLSWIGVPMAYSDKYVNETLGS